MNVGELLIRIGADTRGVREGVRETRREIDSLPDEHVIRIRVEDDRNRASGGGGLNRHRNMLQAIVSLLPIAAAGIQVTAGALGGLVSMLGAATAGAAGFAAVAVSTLNDVFDAQKQIEKANKDIANASTEAERAIAVNNLAKAYKGLNEYQLVALGALQRFKSFWGDFVAQFQPSVVVAFSQALDGIRFVLEKSAPAIRATANAILLVFQRMKMASQSEDFKKFFQWLGGSAGGAISSFGSMFLNTMRGVMNLMVAFQPVSDSMQSGLVGMTAAFLKWTQGLKESQTFKDFMSFTITVGPQFIELFRNLFTVLVDIGYPLSKIGAGMLFLINKVLQVADVVLKSILAFVAWGSGVGSVTERVNGLTNALRRLFGFQTKATGIASDSLYDVDKAYKDIFGSVGDVTGGINDAKKAADGFLASFDEVHNVPDFGESLGGGVTVPKPPTGGSTGGGTTTPIDDEEVKTSTGWLQSLIDKIKEIPPLIPMKIDPPDGGTGLAAIAVGSLSAALGILTGNITLAKNGWSDMVNGFQTSLSTSLPAILEGLGSISLSLIGMSPVMSLTHLNWHGMLDAMQSKLNAYRPYLEYGLALLAGGLGDLQSAQQLLESAWGKSWQTMYANQVTQSNKMIDSFQAVQAAYLAMQKTLGNTAASPSLYPVGKQSLVMDDLIGSGAGAPASAPAAAGGGIVDLLKNFDYAAWFKEASAKLGEAGVDIGLGLSGLKGAQLAGKLAPALKAWLEGMVQGGGKAITGFASGGIVANDSIVRVGEGGRNEAIIPLGGNAMQPFADAIASSMGGGSGSGTGGDIVLQIDGVEFARITAPYNLQESQRIGGSMMTIR